MNLINKLLPEDNNLEQQSKSEEKSFNFCFCLNLKYCFMLRRKYFNVEQQQIKQRMKSAILMKPTFSSVIGTNPDLYGPFWIATTLIVIIIATSSILFLFSNKQYNFEQIPITGCLIYGIAFGCPYIIAIAMKIFGGRISVVDLICIYGYSLTIFLPVTIFCFINHFWIQSILIAIAYFVSVIFLIRGILSLDQNLGDRQKIVISVFILGIQFILILMYKYYFFHLI